MFRHVCHTIHNYAYDITNAVRQLIYYKTENRQFMFNRSTSHNALPIISVQFKN